MAALDSLREHLIRAVQPANKAPASLAAAFFGGGFELSKPAEAATLVEPLTAEQRAGIVSAAAAELLPGLLASIQGTEAENAGAAPSLSLDDALAGASKLALILYALAEDADAPLPSGFMDLAAGLHDCLWSVDSEDESVEGLRRTVLRLCERLWTQGRPDRERVIALSFPMLVAACLDAEASDADVRRAWLLRDALGLFDFACPESEGLRDMLVRCFAVPAPLRKADSRRFLVAILCVGPAFVEAAHACVRTAIPGAPKRSLDAWGDVYARAWAAGDAGVRLAIESRVVQDLVFRAAHAASPELFSSLTRVLAPFIEQKGGRTAAAGVEALAFRALAPVLWRALGAANPAVRRNAALLLFAAFPVVDPDASARDTEAGAEQQFAALHALLKDDCPSVREVAVQGVARVLNVYWEAIPTAESRALVKVIVSDLSHDARSPAVRAAVPAAIAFLLTQPLCHGIVAPLLPELAPLIHDRSDKVRAAMAELLLAVAPMRTLNVFAVVGADQLLARMAMDAHLDAVASPLAALLLPSFVAAELDNKEMLRRLVVGVQESGAALFAIMAHAHRSVPAGTLAKVMLVLKAAIVKAIKTRDARLASAAAGASAIAEQAAAAPEEADAPAEPEEEEEEDADAGFRRKRGGQSASASRGRAKVARGAAAPTAPPAAAASAPPKQQPSEPAVLLDAGNGDIMAGLTRLISVLWATLAPLIDEKSGAAAAADGAAALPQTRARLVEEFGGDTVARLLRCLSDPRNTWEEAPGGGSGAGRVAVLAAGTGTWAVGASAPGHVAGITAALLSIAGHLPHESVVGLAESVWERLVALPPAAVPSELPGLISCLTAWGRVGDAVTAALASLQAAVGRADAGAAPETIVDDGEEEGGSGLMHPRVAIQLVEVVFTNAAAGVADGPQQQQRSAEVTALLPHALTLLFTAMRAAPAAAAAPDASAAASLAAFAASAGRAWCRVLIHAVRLLLASAEGAGSSDAAAQVSAFVASSAAAAVRWVAEAALPAAVAIAEDNVSGSPEDSGAVAAAAALRSIVATLASACGDLAGLGLAVEAGVALVSACSSPDGLPLPGDADGAHSVGSALDWVATPLPDAAPLDALLRLSLRLHTVACGNAASVTALLSMRPDGAGAAAAAPSSSVAMASATRQRVWAGLGRLLAATAAAAVSLSPPARHRDDEDEEAGAAEEGGGGAGRGDTSAASARSHACHSLRLTWTAALAEARRGAAPALAGASAGFTAELLAAALPAIVSPEGGGGLLPDACPPTAALGARGEPVPADGLRTAAPAAAALLLACGRGAPAFVSLAQALAARWVAAVAPLRRQQPGASSAPLSDAAADAAQAGALALLALCSATLSACPAPARRGVVSALESALGAAPPAAGAVGPALSVALAAVQAQFVEEEA